jgi:hypothetical protein
MPRVSPQQGAAVIAAWVAGLAVLCTVSSTRWIGTSFPGFFVMANRVVASVSLPHWPVVHDRSIYQQAVVAVNSQPVATAAALYERVHRLPPGTLVTYTLEQDGRRSQVTLPSVRFTLTDYVLLFAAYLVNGLAIALVSLWVWGRQPSAPASWALLSLGGAAGLFALTATDLYSPYWFFRLHVLSEALFPAGLVHLALVFPVERPRHARTTVLVLPYLVALGFGAAYEMLLYQPAAYSRIHNLCMVYAGLGGLTLLGSLVWAYWTTQAFRLRQRLGVLLLGALSGYAFPAVLMFYSGVSGGAVAVNYAAFTTFLFPLGLGYVVIKRW